MAKCKSQTKSINLTAAMSRNVGQGHVQGSKSKSGKLIFALLILLSCVHVSFGFFGEWGPDLAGPWCAKRPRGQDCCTGRDDDCSVPILGTTCYCDIFCNDTAYDCCPDYWPHCHGMNRPTTTPRPTTLPPRTTRSPGLCYQNGRRYREGETTRDNCNECKCQFDVFARRFRFVCTDNVCLVRPELVGALNDGDYTWQAKNYSKFWGMTLDEGVRYRLGTFLPQDDVLRMNALRVFDDVLPEQFDAREKWPGLLNPVRDQGNCASSWAFSTTAVASDRLSIETAGDIQDEMSAQHLLSCDVDGQLGCEGGHLDRAWWYLRKHGVVTEACYPYTSGKTDNAGECLIGARQRGGECPSGVGYKLEKRYKATPPYKIRPLEREIMKEIMDNGPVQATLLVREDFFMYSRGIYSYSNLVQSRAESSEYVKSGFHSVRIIGWGAERSREGDIIKYWLCANSWGSDWGENGYFRIRRGQDESQIESYVVGVWGKITGDNALRALLKQRRRDRLLSSKRNRRQLRHLVTRRERRRHRRRLRQLGKLEGKMNKSKSRSRRWWRNNEKKHKKSSKHGKKHSNLNKKSKHSHALFSKSLH